tara:strand:+ start:5253 stop:5495 length:243 start_codon:yes stop_codon:yes gene_type:complete
MYKNYYFILSIISSLAIIFIAIQLSTLAKKAKVEHHCALWWSSELINHKKNLDIVKELTKADKPTSYCEKLFPMIPRIKY